MIELLTTSTRWDNLIQVLRPLLYMNQWTNNQLVNLVAKKLDTILANNQNILIDPSFKIILIFRNCKIMSDLYRLSDEKSNDILSFVIVTGLFD